MAEFVVTGKKGAGKGLVTVGKIREYLFQNRIVATNHDLKLHNLIGPHSKQCRVIRVPDKPKIHDLLMIGVGNPTIDYQMISRKDKDGNHSYWDYEFADDQPRFNEDKNGLLALDELGSWMNTRTFSDKDRKPVLDWLIHARKYGWDVIYEVQDLSMIDKQVREGFAEHVVYCRRLDRMPLPLIGAVLPIKMPKVHLGIVKYGTSVNAPNVDKWVIRGTDCYSGYNTLQKFSDLYPHGGFTYLPPFMTHGKYKPAKNWKNRMRITKIIGRRYSRIISFACGFFLSAFAFAWILMSLGSQSTSEAGELQSLNADFKVNTDNDGFLDDYYISGRIILPGEIPNYILKNDDGESISTKELLSNGYKINYKSKYRVLISKDGTEYVVTSL